MKFEKIGKILEPKNMNSWWKSHAMAPSAVLLNEDTIRIFLGCWDENGISRIGFVDVDSSNPLEIKGVSEEPVLDIGNPGMFDENGVFPAHAYRLGDEIYLYYTGFQLGHKVRHYNFGGLAKCDPLCNVAKRVSQAPNLDRKDEGLLVRAGQSVIFEDGKYKTVYSAGSDWAFVGGKMRPTYNVFYQESSDGIHYSDNGIKILEYNEEYEHGLGRPQIVKHNSMYYIFYTTRTLDMKYFFGVSRSKDCLHWERIDNEIEGIQHSKDGWDSEMVYFPCLLEVNRNYYLFYGGNDFGGSGFGVARLISWE